MLDIYIFFKCVYIVYCKKVRLNDIHLSNCLMSNYLHSISVKLRKLLLETLSNMSNIKMVKI